MCCCCGGDVFVRTVPASAFEDKQPRLQKFTPTSETVEYSWHSAVRALEIFYKYEELNSSAKRTLKNNMDHSHSNTQAHTNQEAISHN